MTIARKDSKHQQKMNRGFSLLEMMVALLIVLLGMVFISQVCIHALDALKKSGQRLEISEKFQSFSHYLLSRPFDSEDLHSGHYSRVDSQFIINWDVDDLTDGLKAITLCVRRSHMARKGTLLKSQTILTVGVMQTPCGESGFAPLARAGQSGSEIPIYRANPENGSEDKERVS